MVRLQPYATQAASLQGGKLDHADRMFHSVSKAWAAALAVDGKELVPEFYHCPEVFTNHCGSDLGSKQDDSSIDEVELPPWAKGSPALFVHFLREALECEAVSTQLHHWIDLIFG